MSRNLVSVLDARAFMTRVCTIEYVAKMLGQDAELLEAIIYNDDNRTYGNIISVYVGPEETITGLTDDRGEDMTDMIRAARITTKPRQEFLDDLISDADLVERLTARSTRQQWGGYDVG